MEKIIIDEAVSELRTVNDMMRWAVSQFNAAGLFYGHGTDNAWDEAAWIVLWALGLPLDTDLEADLDVVAADAAGAADETRAATGQARAAISEADMAKVHQLVQQRIATRKPFA